MSRANILQSLDHPVGEAVVVISGTPYIQALRDLLTEEK